MTTEINVLMLSKFEPQHDKTNKMIVRPVKTQINLGIRPVWSESSLCAHWVAKDPSFLSADSEDSDQTGLIWVFAGRTLTLLVLSCRGSFDYSSIFEIVWVCHNKLSTVGFCKTNYTSFTAEIKLSKEVGYVDILWKNVDFNPDPDLISVS